MEQRTDRTRLVTWVTVAILGATCWVGLARPGEGWFDLRTLRLPALGQREEAVNKALFETLNQRRGTDGALASATPAMSDREVSLQREAADIRRQISQAAGD